MPNNSILFNRYIDLEFTTDEESGSKKISFLSPKTGIKPNIAFSMNLLPSGNTSKISVKITNMYSSINIARYKYVRIRAGYRSGLYQDISAEIMDSYVEKPNPEGITIFNCTFGTVSGMYDKDEPVTVSFKAGLKVKDLFNVLTSAFGLKLQMSLPEVWKNVEFTPRAYTQDYRNALEMWSDIKTKLGITSEVLGLPRLYTSVTGNTFYVLSMLEGSDKETSVVLDKVSNAYLMGGAVMVNAPWLPTLQPGALFKMDTRFFRGRIGNLQIGGERKLYRAYSIDVGFSTTNENYMKVNATDLSISKDWF